MSQDRLSNDTPNVQAQSTGYVAPNIDATLTKATEVVNQVTVIHGASELSLNLHGKTVGRIRKSLRDALSLPGDAESVIDGRKVNDDFVLEGGQTLTFSKEAGVKGYGPETKETAKIQWEYKIGKAKCPGWDEAYISVYLNSMGGNGWEMCGVLMPQGPKPTFYFKRQVQ